MQERGSAFGALVVREPRTADNDLDRVAAVLRDAVRRVDFDIVVLSSTDAVYVDADALLEYLGATSPNGHRHIALWGPRSFAEGDADVVIMTRAAADAIEASARAGRQFQRHPSQSLQAYLLQWLQSSVTAPVQSHEVHSISGNATRCSPDVMVLALPEFAAGESPAVPWELLQDCALRCQCDALRSYVASSGRQPTPAADDAQAQPAGQQAEEGALVATDAPMEDEDEGKYVADPEEFRDDAWQGANAGVDAMRGQAGEDAGQDVAQDEAQDVAQDAAPDVVQDVVQDDGAARDDHAAENVQSGEQQVLEQAASAQPAQLELSALLNRTSAAAAAPPCLSYMRRNPPTRRTSCHWSVKRRFESMVISPPGTRLFLSRASTVMRDVASALNGLDIPFFISGGTLLSWTRQCGLGYKPDDIDVSVMIEDFDAEAIKRAFLAKGFTLFRQFGAAGTFGAELAFKKLDVQVDVIAALERNNTLWLANWFAATCSPPPDARCQGEGARPMLPRLRWLTR